MGKVIAEISMSLDGFITGAHQTAENPLGEDGQMLHEWAMSSDNAYPSFNQRERTGASICGWKVYNTSGWGSDGPSGKRRLPTVVVTSHDHGELPENHIYSFAPGIQEAYDKAKSIAGEKDIDIMGGANVIQQFIHAGLLDELVIHIAPVIFTEGTKLFDNIAPKHIKLEIVEVVNSTRATHIRYRIIK